MPVPEMKVLAVDGWWIAAYWWAYPEPINWVDNPVLNPPLWCTYPAVVVRGFNSTGIPPFVPYLGVPNFMDLRTFSEPEFSTLHLLVLIRLVEFFSFLGNELCRVYPFIFSGPNELPLDSSSPILSFSKFPYFIDPPGNWAEFTTVLDDGDYTFIAIANPVVLLKSWGPVWFIYTSNTDPVVVGRVLAVCALVELGIIAYPEP